MKTLALGSSALIGFMAAYALARVALPPDRDPPRLSEGSSSPAFSPVAETIDTLSVMLDGQDLFIDLDASPRSLIGFEHAPLHDEQHRTLLDAYRSLDSGELIRPDSAARCRLSGAFVSLGHGYERLCTDGPLHASVFVPPKAPSALRDASSSDATPSPAPPSIAQRAMGRWSWVCEEPARLRKVAVALFERFEPLDALQVDLDVDGHQATSRLHAARADLVMKTQAGP